MLALELRELTREKRKELGSKTLTPVIHGYEILVCAQEYNHNKKGGFWKMDPTDYNNIEEVSLPQFEEKDIIWKEVSDDDLYGKAIYTFHTIGATMAPYTCPEDDM